jgi:hypothetical protein
MRRWVVMGMFALIAGAACNDSTAPKATRTTRRIFNIQVPARASATDSIRLSFEYDHGYCDSALVVEARPAGAEIRFAVSSFSTKGVCQEALPIAYIRNPVVYVVAPPHALPYTAKFAEPAEPDSVRTVPPL